MINILVKQARITKFTKPVGNKYVDSDDDDDESESESFEMQIDKKGILNCFSVHLNLTFQPSWPQKKLYLMTATSKSILPKKVSSLL